MIELDLYFEDAPHEINKRLVNFLRNILPETIKKGVKFNFHVVNSEDEETLRNKGIINFPNLIFNKKQHLGYTKINQTVLNILNKKNKESDKKSPEDELKEYQKETLGGYSIDSHGKLVDADDDDECKEKKIDLSTLASKEAARRQKKDKSFSPNNDNPTYDTSKRYKKSRIRSQDIPNIRSNNINPTAVETINNMQRNGDADADDMLMQKFFENQEETTV